MAISILLNISLLFCLLIAPMFYAMSVWYKRQIGKTVISWQMPEMVVLTIIFFIAGLLLLIVGVSSFLSYAGIFDQAEIKAVSSNHFLSIGLTSFLFLSSITVIYFGLRKMMVQMVVEKGILVSEGWFPVPGRATLIKWEYMVDYFQQPDFPNVVFNLIVDNQNLRFKKLNVRVPVFLKEEYPSVREYFRKIYGAIQEQIILKKK